MFSGIGWLSTLPYQQQWWWKNHCCKAKAQWTTWRSISQICDALCGKNIFRGSIPWHFCVAERICCSYLWVFVSFLLQVTRDAYAVILAGGTLQPIEETRLRLCPSLAPADIKFFTCNHIVPPESILPIAVTRGPSGMTFDFSYSSRSSPSVVCTFYLIYNIPYPISFCHSSIHCEIWIIYIYFAGHLLSSKHQF